MNERELKEGTTRTTGRDAQRMNIAIGYAVASSVRTTLGPKGMDKMLVDEIGNVTITNDGATILDEMKIGHPAGKIIVEVSKTQDKEVGDGTTTTATICGELLKNADGLLDQKIHASNIIKGYNLATQKVVEYLNNYPSVELTKNKLKEISKVSLGSKNAGVGNNDHISNLLIEAIEKTNNDFKNIQIVSKSGAGIGDSYLVNGLVLEDPTKDTINFENVKVLLIDNSIDVEEPKNNIMLNNSQELTNLYNHKNNMYKNIVETIEKTNAQIVFCKKDIDNVIVNLLRKKNIICFTKMIRKNLENIAKISNAKMVSSVDNIDKTDIGTIEKMYEIEISNNKNIILENSKSNIVTIVLRGGSDHVVREEERAVIDALGSLKSVITEKKYVTGGGAIEMELSNMLREYAKTISGREQLAVESFAGALEIIPKTLAESAGMNVIDTISELKKKHNEKNNYGINVYEGIISDMKELGVIEPLKTKRQAILSASEATQMLLKIDDVIASSKKEE